VKAGRYPAPVKLGPRVTAWRASDIRSLLEAPSDDGTVRISSRNDLRVGSTESLRNQRRA